MEICEKNRCTGCQACMNICPMDAISFHEDLKGFLYPEVSEKCVDVMPAKEYVQGIQEYN